MPNPGVLVRNISSILLLGSAVQGAAQSLSAHSSFADIQNYAKANDYGDFQILTVGANGSLSSARPTAQSQDILFHFETSYGRIAGLLSAVLNGLAQESCSPEAQALGAQNFLYFQCKTVSRQDPPLDLMPLQIPELTRTIEPGAELRSTPFASHLYLQDYGALKGGFVTQSLDNHATINTVSTLAGQNMTMKIGVGPHSAGFVACENFMGASFITDPAEPPLILQEGNLQQTFSGSASLGSANFAASRVCGRNQFKWGALGDQTWNSNLGETSTPRFSSKDLNPIALVADPYELTEELATDLVQTLQVDMADALSGQWILDQQSDYVGVSAARNFSLITQQVLDEMILPTNTASFKKALQNECLVLQFAQSSLYTDAMKNFCDNSLDDFDVKPMAFDQSDDDVGAGCASKYFSIFDTLDNFGKLKWWAQGCHLGLDIAVHASTDDPQNLTLMSQLLGALISEGEIPDSWRREMTERKMGTWMLFSILQKWNQKGLSRIGAQDWQAVDSDNIIQSVNLKILSIAPSTKNK